MSAGPPDLSVIIVTYNTRDLTRACVRAVMADAEPSGQAVEVIVVDNASQDDTLTCLAAEFPAARLIANPANLGFARANNRGLEAAGGRYLFLLNSDTELRPGALGALVAFMDDHPEAGACGPQLLNPDGSLQPSGRPLPSVASVALEMTRLYRLWKRDLYRQPGRDYGQPARVGEISGAALLVRRAVLEQVGGLDPAFFAYYEDTDWCQRMGAYGFAGNYVPAAQVVHHWQGTSRAAAALARRA
ncbi:MAG: glycosyltransferase family 2 protein, partial [Anaerolineales bacterium]|nr:glycosyltransferase family 2 protein [Anaerolineales bacterium]